MIVEKNKLEVIKHISTGHRNPYRIIEIYKCLDGYGTRITHNCFETEGEALAFILDNT